MPMDPYRVRRPFLRLCGLAALLPALAGARPFDPPAPAPPTPFTTEVLANFGDWDADSDGVLEPAELDRLVVDRQVTGKPAAALGALKAAQRSTKVTLPPVTLDYLHTYEAAVAERKTPSPNFDRSYTRALRRISSPKRDLLLGEKPTLESCKQGPLGDCYFVSVVGAAVVRDPGAVLSMISSGQDGSYEVKFGNGKSASVAPLTDAELALTSSSGSNGLWLPVLEKAYGKIRTDALPESKQSESSTDAIAHGGSAAATIRLLTGHATDRIGLRPGTPRTDAKKDTAQPAPNSPDQAAQPEPKPSAKPDAKPSPQTPVDPEALNRHLAEVLPKVREHLARSVKDHRLVAAGTSKEAVLPPGVNPNHAYAVLGYDQSTDTIHLWNPHANTFKPKGEPGLTHGYPTKGGHFEMPLEEFARVFNGISFETDKPLPAR